MRAKVHKEYIVTKVYVEHFEYYLNNFCLLGFITMLSMIKNVK